MNQKTCKKLRRQAAMATVGLPERETKKANQGTVAVARLSALSTPPTVSKHTESLTQNCTRSVYQRMKAYHKNA